MRRLVFAAIALVTTGCAAVKPWERDRLGSPAMAFQMNPLADEQLATVLEISEGASFGGAGPGSAGAGCGCH
jgi:hypothetical protein